MNSGEVNNELILRHWQDARQVQPRLSGFLSVASLSSPHEGHFFPCHKVLLSVGEVNLIHRLMWSIVQWCSSSPRSEFADLGSASDGDIRKTQTWQLCLAVSAESWEAWKKRSGCLPKEWCISCCILVSVGHCGESLCFCKSEPLGLSINRSFLSYEADMFNHDEIHSKMSKAFWNAGN